MRHHALFIAVAALVGISVSVSHAGLDVEAPVPNASELELIVMEAEGCTYCDIFRRDVLPSYQASERGKDVPIRFLDVNDQTAEALGLDSPVDIVPTFVVLKNHREVGRIPGYVGPEFFFHSINHLISSAP
jgi:thioredoxin-related protein